MSQKSKQKKADDFFYGTVTVGERGQIVIPAEARRDYEIETGEKLLIMGHPDKHHLIISKIESIREFLEMMLERVKLAEDRPVTEQTFIDTLENGDHSE